MADRIVDVADVRLLIRVVRKLDLVDALAPLWIRFPEPVASLAGTAPRRRPRPDWLWLPLGRLSDAAGSDAEALAALAVLDRLDRPLVSRTIAGAALQRADRVERVTEALHAATGAGAYALYLAQILNSDGRPDEAARLLRTCLAKGTIEMSSMIRPEDVEGCVFVGPAPEQRHHIAIMVIEADGVTTVTRPLEHGPGRPYVLTVEDVTLEEHFLLHVPGAGTLSDGISYRSRYGLPGRSFFLNPDRSVALHTPLAGDDQVTRIESATYFGKTRDHGHFIVEGLDRLSAYAEGGRPPDAPVLVQGLPRASYRRFLAAMGLPAGDDAYVVANTSRVSCRRLVVGGIGTGLPAVNPLTVRRLSERGHHAVGATGRHGPGGLKLYLARDPAIRRQIANEGAVRTVLEDAGYRTVFLESMDLVDQVALIARASEIIGVHGSALINALWALPGTRVGVFVPDTWREWRAGHVEMLFGMFDAVGLEAAALACEAERSSDGYFQQFNESLVVSLPALTRWLGSRRSP